MPDLAAAIDDYLTYLRVERGLAPATIRAYRADLTDFAASRGVTRGWAGSPDPAVGYLRHGRGAAAAATPASPRAAFGAARPRSRASTGSPTARA